MAEFPSLPLFTDAYLGDTTHLTTIEHGAYLLLLMTQWRSKDCRLPDDDKMLARYVKMTAQEWSEARVILESFFHVSGGFWVQLRLRDEREYVETKRKKNIEAGKVSALKRKGRHSTPAPTDAPTNVQPESNQPTPLTPNPHPVEKDLPTEDTKNPKPEKGKRLEAYLAEHGVNETAKAWGEWALAEGMTAKQADTELQQMRDWALSAPGQKGVKADWPATWRGWVRRELKKIREQERKDEIFRNKFKS